MLNPSTVTLLAAGVQQAVSMTAQVVPDSLLKKNVCRLTISYSSLQRDVTCTVNLSDAIKTSDGRTLAGGYSFSFTTAPAPIFVSTLPTGSSVVTPISYVTLTASENIKYSGAVVTVGGTAMSTPAAVGSSDLTGSGTVLKIRMPDACFAWSDAGTGPLKTVQVSVSGVTAELDDATLPNVVLTYSLERAWHEVGAFDAALPVMGDKSRTVQLAATDTHLYLAYFASGMVYLHKFDLGTKTWNIVGSWLCPSGVFALTSTGTEAYLLHAFDAGQIFLHDGSGNAVNSHTPVSGVVPTSLDAVASGTMLWYVFNSTVAGANYLEAWSYDAAASSFNQVKNFSPSSTSHDYPSIALNGPFPWVLYAQGTSIQMWDVNGSAGYGPWSGFFNGVAKLMYVNSGIDVLLFETGSIPTLKVSKTRPFTGQVNLYRTPTSSQADAFVMDGTTPVFMYPVDPVGTSSLVCDGWYDGMSDMRPLATQSLEVSSYKADWSVVGTGIALGARPAIVATPGAVFAAWYDSVTSRVYVRRHDGR